MDVDGAIAQLKNAKGNYRCSELVRLLESLGFVVDGRRVKHHKQYKHPRLPNFSGANFSCQHGKTPLVKPGYINRVRKVLETWKDELEELP